MMYEYHNIMIIQYRPPLCSLARERFSFKHSTFVARVYSALTRVFIHTCIFVTIFVDLHSIILLFHSTV